MLYVGLDLSRNRLDFRALREGGELVERGAVPADREGLARLVYLLGGHDLEVAAVIESMNGARFVHDQLELVGFEVEIADAAGQGAGAAGLQDGPHRRLGLGRARPP
jgi:hypothetical protein